MMRFGQIYWVVTLCVFCYFIYSLDRFEELSTTNKQQPRHFADEETGYRDRYTLIHGVLSYLVKKEKTCYPLAFTFPAPILF